MTTSLLHVRLDPSAFDPWRIQAVEHDLGGHPLLRTESLVDLGRRLEARGRVRTHSDQADAATPFNDAPRLHPNPRPASETLADIANARAWTSLLNIQTDPVYRELVDEVLDQVRPLVEVKDPGMCYRAGWIFVTSPNAVTPFHIDKEHNFILQVAGRKRLYVWDPSDAMAVSERGRELFHARHSRDLVRWDETLRSRAVVFDLAPGQGGYMPSTSPHMVENGDEPSVTVSFTYYTNATRRRNLLYRAHHHLRRLGFRPPQVAESSAFDIAVHAAFRAYVELKEGAGRLFGRPIQSTGAPYAFAQHT